MAPATGSSAARALAACIDHTLLAPAATPEDVARLCDEAHAHGFANVCVNGAHVARCAARLRGSAVGVCAVVGFPLGADHPEVKLHAARRAVQDGARELDVVMDLGSLRARELDVAAREIEAIVAAARAEGGLVKVILETGLLARDEIVLACRVVESAGAAFVKTSTGYGPRGASVADVELLRSCVGTRLGIKASGGIRSAVSARELLAAGATRLGCSASVAIVREA